MTSAEPRGGDRPIIVIPARWGSTRFPGKPLERILDHSLIERTWRIAKAVAGVEEVFVATDDARIAEHVRGFGGMVAMTDPDCRNGTERVHAALGVVDRSPRAVINLQGDAVLTPPWVIEAVVSVMGDDGEVEMATPAVRLTWPQYEELHRARAQGVVGGTTVTCDEAGNALYFSKALIPNVRDPGTGPCPVLRHIGLYGYTTTVLAQLLELEPGPLEKAEHLEQLRALEHRIRIQVVEVDYRGRTHGSVDNPGDIATVEQIIRREGELV